MIYFYPLDFLLSLLILSKAQLIYCQTENTTKNNMDAFKEHQVIPDVLDKEPQQILNVEWTHGQGGNGTAELGNILAPSQMVNQPSVTWKGDPHSYYTLIMSDPDAPSRGSPKAREWLHWLVVNIPGDNISQADTLKEYAPPTPPSGSGLHRYVISVFKQNMGRKESFEDLSASEKSILHHREKFHTKAFVKKHMMQELVGANFIQAES